MVNYLFDIARAVFTAVVILFFLMAPEMVLGFVYPSFSPCWDPSRLAVLMALALSLSFVKNKRFLTVFLIVFGSLQIVQFGMALSSGRYVTPFDLDTLAANDIFSALKGKVWYHGLLLSGMVFVPYLILEYIFVRGILNPPAFKKGWILTILFLAGFTGYAVSEEGRTETQKTCCYASYNTLSTSAFYVAERLPQAVKEKWPDVSFAGLSAQAAEE